MYIFNHIPKTGGVSMYQVIESLIGSDRLSPHLKLNEDVAYDVNPRDYDQYLVIYGHIGVVFNDILGPNRRWMTILRNPVDRILSQYYYWRNIVPPSPHLPYVHAAQTLPLEEFVRSRHEKLLQANENAQTWQLADDLRIRYRKIAPRDALEIAKYHLSERCAFIGIFEEYRRSVERLCYVLQVPPPNSIPTENRTPGRKALDEIHPDVISAIEELNTMDLALYDYGKEIVAKRTQEASC